MCGIAGIFAFRESAPSIDRAALDRMCAHMAVRGPDGAGTWVGGGERVALGHRRLAIIDLSAGGAQPMHSRDGRLVISFNGEIYNFRALRAELERKGYRFETQSDTEVLLHLYADRGEAMVHALRGMFAFALWDNQAQTMFLARDPFGIKPLYYSTSGGTLRLASEVKALTVGGGIDTDPEPAGHVGFFLWGCVPEPYTLYKGIRALPAGCTLTVKPGHAGEPKSYADLVDLLHESEATSQKQSPEDLAAELRQAMLDTVRHHLVADVDVGVFLSAGLDSTTQAALVAELGGRLRTVTLGFAEYRGTSQDEVPLAELVAKRYGADHQTIWVTREEFRADLDRVLSRMDQPTTDGVNTFFVSKAAAAAGLKVALSGLGGDELFGGYPSFRQLPRFVSLVKNMPGGGAVGRGVRRLLAPGFRLAGSPKYAGLLEYGRDYGSAYLLRRCVFLPWELDRLLDRDIVDDGWKELGLPMSIDATAQRLTDTRLKISALESSLYMRNQLLRDTDWSSMSFSLEVRVPMVDWALWSRVSHLSTAERPVTKRMMAATPQEALPQAVLTRAKSGFAIPTRRWLMNEMGRRTTEPGLRGWAQYVYGSSFSHSSGLSHLAGRTASRRVSTRNALPVLPAPGDPAQSAGVEALPPVTNWKQKPKSSAIRDSLFRIVSRPLNRLLARPLDLSRVEKILVLQLQQLGDTVAFTPALRALRDAYPDAQIHMLVNDISYGVYAKCPYVSRFYVARWAGGASWRTAPLRGLLREARSERYDLCIADVTQRSVRYGMVALLTGARSRVGFDADNRGFLFSTRLPYTLDQSVIDANLSLARALGAATPTENVECYFDAGDEAYAASLIPAGRGAPLIIGLHPASNWQSKTWFPDRWALLADALVEKMGASLFLVGSGAEREYVDEVIRHMKMPATSLAGRTNLPQLAAFLARCDLVVGTDSGPRHLAAGSARPQVTLMSAHERVQRWHFHREQEIVLRTDVPCSPCFQSYCSHQSCMKGISVDAVLAACTEVLHRSATGTVAAGT